MHGQIVAPAKVVSVGIDWITATAKPGTRRDFLETSANQWGKKHEEGGNRVKEWSWKGYNGKTMDSLSIGHREDGTIVRLSGDLAKRHGDRVIWLASHVSRIDLQVTVEDEGKWINHAADGLKQASKDRRVKAGMTRTALISTTPDGVTAYIGSRASDRFFRIYDKSAESKGLYARGTWRYEVEYKAGRAGVVAQYLRRTTLRPEDFRAVVEQAFDDYGVTLPCLALPPTWRDTSPREETTDERRLTWLSTTIRPAVEKLMESLDGPTVLEALGLSQLQDGVIVSNATGEVVSK